MSRIMSIAMGASVLVSSYACHCQGDEAQPAKVKGPPQYQITVLPLLEGFTNSRAYGLNGRGEVVGQVAALTDKMPLTKAVLWKGGAVREIETGPETALPVAEGINDPGVIVGGGRIENYGSSGFHFMGMKDNAYLWSDAKTRVLSNETSHAYALNAQSTVCGVIQGKPVLWTGGAAKPTPLDVPKGDYVAEPYAISNAQIAVGMSYGPHHHAVVWRDGLVLTIELPAGQDESIACGVNEKGHVVGSYGSNWSYWNMPFVWVDGHLETLPPLEGSTWHNQVLGINNHDQMVGCGMSCGAYMHAVTWIDRVPFDLNLSVRLDPKWVLMKAVAVNDSGQIAGELRDNHTNIRAFLLTPIP